MGEFEFNGIQASSHPDDIFSGKEFIGQNGYKNRVGEDNHLYALIPFKKDQVESTSDLGTSPLGQSSDQPNAEGTDLTSDASNQKKYKVKLNVEIEADGPMPANPFEFLQNTFTPKPVQPADVAIASLLPYRPATHVSFVPQPSVMDFAQPVEQRRISRIMSQQSPAEKPEAPRAAVKKPKNRRKIRLGLKRGGIHMRAVGIAAAIAIVPVTGLAIETHNDAKRAGEVCNNMAALALKQVTGIDTSQACETSILTGDMFNLPNLLTIVSGHHP